MGHGVQEKKIAKYERRRQREAPACLQRTLFEQNNAIRVTYTVTLANDCSAPTGAVVHAHRCGNTTQLAVTNAEGRRVGMIDGESGRVLALAMREYSQFVVSLTVIGITPVCGDLQVRIITSNQ